MSSVQFSRNRRSKFTQGEYLFGAPTERLGRAGRCVGGFSVAPGAVGGSVGIGGAGRIIGVEVCRNRVARSALGVLEKSGVLCWRAIDIGFELGCSIRDI